MDLADCSDCDTDKMEIYGAVAVLTIVFQIVFFHFNAAIRGGGCDPVGHQQQRAAPPGYAHPSGECEFDLHSPSCGAPHQKQRHPSHGYAHPPSGECEFDLHSPPCGAPHQQPRHPPHQAGGGYHRFPNPVSLSQQQWSEVAPHLRKC